MGLIVLIKLDIVQLTGDTCLAALTLQQYWLLTGRFRTITLNITTSDTSNHTTLPMNLTKYNRTCISNKIYVRTTTHTSNIKLNVDENTHDSL